MSLLISCSRDEPALQPRILDIGREILTAIAAKQDRTGSFAFNPGQDPPSWRPTSTSNASPTSAPAC